MLLQLPACLMSVFVMYWSLPIGCLLYRIRFLDIFSSQRADVFNWAALLLDWFRARVYKVGGNSLYKGKTPVIYLCNHRSWADFFIDKCVSPTCCMLSLLSASATSLRHNCSIACQADLYKLGPCDRQQGAACTDFVCICFTKAGR